MIDSDDTEVSSRPVDPRDALFATDEMSEGLGRRAGEASLLLLGMAVLRGVLQLGTIAILARLVSPAEYGVFAMAIPVVMLGTALSNFGLPQAIVQRRTIDHSMVSTLFWLNVAFAAIAAVVIALLGWPMSAALNTPAVLPVFWVVGLIVLFSAMSGQYIAILRRTLRIRQIENTLLFGEIVGVAVAVAVALAGGGYWALVLQQIVQQAAALVVFVFRTGWVPSGPLAARPREAMDALAFGGFVAGSSMLIRFTDYAGNLVAAGAFGEAVAGLFYRARNLSKIPQRKVLTPLSGTFVPALSRVQDDPAAFSEMFVRLISRASLLSLPATVLLATGSDPLVAILLGPDWAGSAPLLAWMSLMTLTAPLQSGLQFVMIARGQSRMLFVVSIIRLVAVGLALVVGATAGLIPMVAAFALIEAAVTLAVQVPVALKCSPLNFNAIWRASLFDTVYAIVVAALVMAVVKALPDLPDILTLCCIGAAIGLAFGVRVLCSAALRRDVLRAVKSLSNMASRRMRSPGTTV